MENLKSNLEAVFKEFPDLSPLGFVSEYAFYPWCWPEDAIQAEIRRGQRWLRSPAGLSQISFVVSVLEKIRKTIACRVDSYFLKDSIFETKNLPDGSFSHGALIAGAFLCGFRILPDGLSACFNMSKFSLKKAGLVNA